MIDNLSLSKSFHLPLLTGLMLQINISTLSSLQLISNVKKNNFDSLLKNRRLTMNENYQYKAISDYGGKKKSMEVTLSILFVIVFIINICTLVFYIHQKKTRKEED